MIERTLIMALRDFIYLDKNRMYSLYSQLFKGVVESLVESVSCANKETKEGKKLENTIIDASVKVQNVVLFDHIYNSLEEKMKDYILTVDENKTKESIRPDSIIKITGFPTIEDYGHLSYLMRNFNDIGLALSTLTLMDTDKTAPISKNAVEKYAKENNLNIDKKLTDSINAIIENFYGESIELTIETEQDIEVDFKAILDKSNLRITPNTLRNLYGYKPHMKWTLLGEVTKISYMECDRTEKPVSVLADMFKCLDDIDCSFFKSNNIVSQTIRVAPIAVYIDRNGYNMN